jgi:hypothetical protein
VVESAGARAIRAGKVSLILSKLIRTAIVGEV